MKNNKIPALLLAAAMAASIVACGQENNDVSNDSSPSDNSITNDQTASDNELPDRDLEQFTLNLGKPLQSNVAWANITFAPLEELGDVMNDAIFRRNRKMMELYNFELSETEISDPLATMNQQILAGDADYDLFLIALNNTKSVAKDEYLINWYDVPNIELEEAWWDQDMQRDLDLGDGMYFMNGDIIFSVYDCLLVNYYCKDLVEDLKLEDKYGHFYDIVTDGKWTVDLMLQMMQDVTLDLNSDGVMDYQDRYGVMYNNNFFNALLTSQNHQVVAVEDGKPTLNVFNEKFTKVYENLVRFRENNVSIHHGTLNYNGLSGREAIVTMFNNKQSLFFENGISAAAQYLRNIEDVDFGFMPMPKYDETQTEYYSYASVTAPVFCIPKTISEERLDAAGFVLEALCRESRASVVPEYFETCFSKKYVRDDRSYEMIVLATESRRYDLGIIYDYGGLGGSIVTAAEAKTASVASTLESLRSVAEEAIKDYHGE